MTTNEEFIKLAEDSGLTLKAIAELIETPYGTVKNWTRGTGSESYRSMPRHALIAVRYSIESALSVE